MDWLRQLNDALRYLEEQLDGELDLNRMAQMAGCSPFHFQRMFSYMAGVPLAEYIRRRRMTRAAFVLIQGDKVIDVALRYGYESPTAFSRAFRSVHGVAPSAARQEGIPLKACHPISFDITIRGEAAMYYRIEKRDAFRTVGVKMRTCWPVGQGGTNEDIPRFWAMQKQQGIIPRLREVMSISPWGIMGMSVGFPGDVGGGRFDYYIAAACAKPVPRGMTEFLVPAKTWAVFESKGPMPAAIAKTQERIMTEWFPGSGYRYADGPDIEVYSDGDTSAEDYLCWIWVPVQKA